MVAILASTASVKEENVPTLSVTLSPASINATNVSGDTVSTALNAVTATPIGGTGPYTYTWTRVSGYALAEATDEFSQDTGFSAEIPFPGTQYATFKCEVVDLADTRVTGFRNILVAFIRT